MDRCRCETYSDAIKKLRFYTVGTHRPDIIENYDRKCKNSPQLGCVFHIIWNQTRLYFMKSAEFAIPVCNMFWMMTLALEHSDTAIKGRKSLKRFRC